ncbi:MAG: hypothetical protein AMS24_01375 [Chlamydiae bacterium SM23_39]|nr:MAG: hypothetical protein AMS24_01375 [Chlamydiae bacterium SM23_39]
MKKKHILVTGGAGYIGSQTCKMLKKKEFLPICLDNLSTGNKNSVKWGPLIIGDLTKKETLEKVFKKYEPLACIHFAGVSSVYESFKNPKKYYKNNIEGSLNLFSTMKKYKVRTLIFSSSASIYGNPKKIPIKETHIKNPISAYGKSKLEIEKILKNLQKRGDLNYISLRYFNAAGADIDVEIGENHKDETHLIPLVIYAALNKRKHIKIYGNDYPTPDKTAIRDYIHVTDLADAHIKSLFLLLQKRESIQLNLGSGHGYSVKEIIDAIKKYTTTSFKIIHCKRRRGDPPILVADNSKAKKFLNWKPKYSDLKTIILTAWRWHKKCI